MTDTQIQRKLNQLRKIANELVAEAEERWGEFASLSYASGYFNLQEHCDDSQEHTKFSSTEGCRMDSGDW